MKPRLDRATDSVAAAPCRSLICAHDVIIALGSWRLPFGPTLLGQAVGKSRQAQAERLLTRVGSARCLLASVSRWRGVGRVGGGQRQWAGSEEGPAMRKPAVIEVVNLDGV